MKSGRRLAIVCRQVAGLSGATNTVLQHAQRLSTRGWSVHVYAQWLDREAVASVGGSGHWIPGWPFGGYFKRLYFAKVADFLTGLGRFDIIHGHGDEFVHDVLSLHNCVHATHEALTGKSLPRNSTVGRLHSRILRAQKFRRLIVNSRLMAEDVVRRFGIAPKRITVIYPGHDPKKFRADERQRWHAETRRRLGVGHSELLFGLITSGDFAKRGVWTFLQALGLLRRRGLAFKALVIGKESHPAPYLRRVEEEGLNGLVRFLPPVPDVEKYYHALDVYVHPARFEEFGQSVQEALACGLPVITGAHVGAAELILGRMRDFLLTKYDAAELAAKMTALSGDPVFCAQLGLQGPQMVAHNTWDRNLESTLAVYESLLASPKKDKIFS